MLGRDALAVMFAALGNEERLSILAVLSDRAREQSGGASISCVADAVGISRFSASRHLRILAAAGFVVADRIGHAVLHQLDEAGLESVEDWICGCLPEIV